ncbi:MAG: leucine-rich repeat domain-containing protein [Prevotella sp.]|nr:leucine-rich repeat domain-containing protein [Prevotella sp.]
MNKLILKTGELLAVLLLFCFAPARAEDFTAESSGTTFYYNILTDGEKAVEVTYYAIGANANSAAYTGSLQIPSSVTNDGTTYSVTRIGERAFNGCSGITSVEIPSSVTCIRDSAFVGCSGLATVTFAETSGLTTIENKAFYNCSSLSSITIPTSVTSLGDYAFYGCSKLASITVPSGVTSIGSYTFYNCSSLTSITIPDNVTTIGSNAFYGCGFTSISIPSTVTSIGSSAFAACTKLTSIDIPSSVTSIGGSAFYGCSGLTSISIPSGVASIGTLVFRECTALTKIEVSEENTNYCSEDGVLFTNDKKELMQYPLGSTLAEYEVPAAVETIDERAFAYCASDLSSVTLANAVATIGSSVFYSCKGLKTVVLGSAVSSIGTSAFGLCSAITEMYSLNATPPVFVTESTSQIGSTSITLYAPADSKDAYASWSPVTKSNVVKTRLFGEVEIKAFTDTDEDTGEQYGYATYYLGSSYHTSYDYPLNNNLRCATATLKNDSILTLNWVYGGDEGDTVVPAATAVVVYGTLGKHYPLVYEEGDEVAASEDSVDNLLLGSDTATTTYASNNATDGYKFYWLSYSEIDEETGIYKDIGFYYGATDGAAFQIGAHKAWLPLEDSVAAKITSFVFDNSVGDGSNETTAIRTIENDVSSKLGDDIIYNLAGQRVNSMSTRGIYIVGGKKVVKK